MTNLTEAPMANAIDDVKGAQPSRLAMEIAVHMEVHAALSTTTQAKAREIDALLVADRLIITSSKHTGWSDEAVEAQAALCSQWPLWLHEAVTRVTNLADTKDWSTEQVVGYAILTAASSIAQATWFEVKALEWEPVQDEGVETEQATTPFGYYRIFEDEDSAAGALFVQFAVHPDRFCMVDAISVDRVHSWNGAKAAAQADFNARIRSSISPSVSKESGEPS